MVRRRFYTPFFSGSSTSTSTSTSTSMPTHSSTTHALASAFIAQRSSPSHVVVDLAQPQVEDAVGALLGLRPLRQKVRSATVHANTLLSSPGRYVHGRIQFELSHVVSIFEKLAQLPRLTSLTVEMNYHVISLPVTALLAALSTKRLKKLQLKHLHLVGTCSGTSQEEFEQLAKLAATQTRLHSLSMESCRGVEGINALVYHLPELTDLKLISTPLASPSPGGLTRVHVVQLLKPNLRSLKLDDVHDLDDSHCKSLAQALAWPECQLQQLHISSSMLADASAQALTQMLLLNTSLSRFAIHIDSTHLGGWIANVISANTPTLTHLDVGLYNDKDSATQDCIDIAMALRKNCHLTHLRLRLEIELENLPQNVMHAFEVVAQQVPTVALQSLSIDDGVHQCPLQPQMKLQLYLNQCGVRQLLHQQVRTSQEQVDTLLSTLAVTADGSVNGNNHSGASLEQLDATFTLLSNLPELFHLALEHGKLEDHHDTAKSANTNSIAPVKRGQESEGQSERSNSAATLTHKKPKPVASATHHHAPKEWIKLSMSSLLRRSTTTASIPKCTPKKAKHLIPHAA